jgi:hypothetical protein
MTLKVTLAAGAALALLAACSPAQEQSVANRFNQVETGIANTANTLENETANIAASTEREFDNRAAEFHNQADALENRIDAIDVVPSSKPGNRQ